MQSYRFRASHTFWRNFYRLSTQQKASTRSAWQTFKRNPFDASLSPHKIERLSGLTGRPIWAVTVEKDLRVIFCVKGDTVFTMDIGDHSIYGRAKLPGDI